MDIHSFWVWFGCKDKVKCSDAPLKHLTVLKEDMDTHNRTYHKVRELPVNIFIQLHPTAQMETQGCMTLYKLGNFH